MNDLRKAAQDVIARWDSPNWSDNTHTRDYINALREALQAEPEPVAIIHHDLPNHVGWNPETDVLKFKDGEKLYTTPPSVDALIAEIDGITEYAYDDFKGFECLPKAKVIAILDKYRGAK